MDLLVQEWCPECEEDTIQFILDDGPPFVTFVCRQCDHDHKKEVWEVREDFPIHFLPL